MSGRREASGRLWDSEKNYLVINLPIIKGKPGKPRGDTGNSLESRMADDDDSRSGRPYDRVTYVSPL